MKITAIEIKHYLLPLDPPFKAAWDPSPRKKFPATIVRVNTDEGICGIGSGDAMLGLAGHEHLFIGHDPFEIERHWQILDNIDFHYGRRWHDFKEMNTLGSLDVYQPDVVLTGGITGVKQIAEWVQNKGAWFSPHTWTNGIGLIANLHLACAVSKCPYLEFPFDPPTWTTARRDFMLRPDNRLMIDKDGYLHVPESPGLGCELDEEALARYAVDHVYVGEE